MTRSTSGFPVRIAPMPRDASTSIRAFGTAARSARSAGVVSRRSPPARCRMTRIVRAPVSVGEATRSASRAIGLALSDSSNQIARRVLLPISRDDRSNPERLGRRAFGNRLHGVVAPLRVGLRPQPAEEILHAVLLEPGGPVHAREGGHDLEPLREGDERPAL